MSKHASPLAALLPAAHHLAKAGRMTEARSDCAAGIAILTQTLGADASFTKSSAATCAALGPALAKAP